MSGLSNPIFEIIEQISKGPEITKKNFVIVTNMMNEYTSSLEKRIVTLEGIVDKLDSGRDRGPTGFAPGGFDSGRDSGGFSIG